MALARSLTVLLTLVALIGAAVSPPVVHAQSAGDEQYVDPFEQGGSGKSDSSEQSSGSGSDSSGGSSQTSKSGTQGSGSQESGSSSTPGTSAPAHAPATTLARTGADLRLPLAVGLALLLVGAFMFRWLRPVRS